MSRAPPYKGGAFPTELPQRRRRRGVLQPFDASGASSGVWRPVALHVTAAPMEKPRPHQKPAPSAKLAVRQKREADALRANLRKRKDQARAREKPKQE